MLQSRFSGNSQLTHIALPISMLVFQIFIVSGLSFLPGYILGYGKSTGKSLQCTLVSFLIHHSLILCLLNIELHVGLYWTQHSSWGASKSRWNGVCCLQDILGRGCQDKSLGLHIVVGRLALLSTTCCRSENFLTRLYTEIPTGYASKCLKLWPMNLICQLSPSMN